MRDAAGTIVHFMLAMTGLVLAASESPDLKTTIITSVIGLILFICGAAPAVKKSAQSDDLDAL